MNAAEAAAGIYSSIYIHEGGHALAYKLMGATDVAIEVPRPGTIFSGQTTGTFTSPFTQDQLKLATVSGFAAASLAEEMVMQHKGLQSSSYAQSILGNIAELQPDPRDALLHKDSGNHWLCRE